MKNLVRFVGILAMATLAAMQAQAQLINETFTYLNGDLPTMSSGVWSNHSGLTGAGDVQVSSDKAVLAGSASLTGDDNRLLGGTFSSGTTLWASFDLDMSVAPVGAGTYFIHFKNSGSFFDPRIWAINDGGSGFKLGIANASNGSTVGSPLTGSLSLGTTYRVVFELDQTMANMASTLWVDPITTSSTSIMATDVVVSGTPIVAIALRQSTGEGTMTIDNLLVDTTAAGVGLIPEPSTIMLLGTGLLGLLAIRRRRS